MITIILGTDSLSKQVYIQNTLAGQDREIQTFRGGDSLPNLAALNEPMLFGPAKAYVFEGCWDNLDAELLLNTLAESSTQVFIIEQNLDKRKSVNQGVLKDKRVLVKEFIAPSGNEAAAWIVKHAAENDIRITEQAAKALASALAPEGETLPVHRTHQELLKLSAYAGEDEITPGIVAELIAPVVAIDMFELLNKIAGNDKKSAMAMLDNFFNKTSGDDKAKAIQIVSLFADQLRNMLLVLEADKQGVPEAQLLKSTGWKSGRLYIVKKLAKQFTTTRIKETLAKLENLDMELKSSTLPPHIILDLIITGM